MKKIIPIAISAVACVALVLCIILLTKKQIERQQIENNTPISSVVFNCEDDKNIQAVFFKRRVELVLSDQRKISLPQAISASGARYANKNESFVFWNKGDTAFINEGSITTYNNCVIKNNDTTNESPEDKTISHINKDYGFIFNLPDSWNGYSIIKENWVGNYFNSDGSQSEKKEYGPIINIRHPQWTKETPRQDVPIMVFTIDQWNLLEKDKIHIGAAPINPSKLGQNSKYVFALPARYNFAFLTGFEEVEDIIKGNPLMDISWKNIINAINGCKVKSVMQTHSQLVTAVLKDDTKIEAFEPKIDDVMDITSNAIKTCGEIIRATE